MTDRRGRSPVPHLSQLLVRCSAAAAISTSRSAGDRHPPRQLAALIAVALLAVAGCGGGDDDASSNDQARAINEAKQAYAKVEAQQIDLTRGPCIAERLPGLPDWVVDIAHDPRAAVDDEAANQCARYRAGEAHHFVELDPSGELIRAQ